MKKFWVSTLALLLSLSLCVSLLPAAFADRDETYLISITTADGVVTSGYRDEWRWVALSRGDSGRPDILLYESWGNPDVHGSLKRSDAGQPGAPQSGEELTAWGKAQDGKPATLTLGKESWECTARYQEYYGGKERVLYVEFLRDEETGLYSQPDSDTTWLFRYDWAQEAAGKYTAALEQLTQEEGYVLDRQLDAYKSTVVLRHKEVPAPGGEAAYQDYELCLVRKRAYASDPVRRLLLPSTTLVGDYAPTDRVPDSITVSEDGYTLTYVYSFDSPLTRPNGEILHEAGTYTYVVDTGTGELTVSHSGGFTDVPAGSWFEKGVATCAEKGVMVGTGEGRFSPATELSDAECLTMALRLYDLQRGGDGTLEKTPEGYGYMTLALSDGKTFSRYGEYTPFFHYHVPDGGGAGTVYVQAPGETPEERESYAQAHQGKATLTVEGKTYSGTVTAGTFGYYYGPCLLFAFDCPEAQQPDLDELFGHYIPAPDKWYRDAVYTAYQWGLNDADGFHSLVNWCTSQPSPHSTSRDVFAQALAVAAGELEKKYDVPRIPDVERQYHEYLYGLYEAGILNGTDSFGTFQADKELTRAECAVMVARVLDSAQRLTEPPATPNGYEQAVIELRSKLGHHNEQRFDTDDCTVFVFDRGGFMNAPAGAMTVIYKPGSQPGDGYVLELPHVRNGMRVTPADTMVFDPENGTFTYSYFYETTAWDSSIQGDDTRIEPGTVTFTVDLPTGTVHREHRGIDYAGAMAHVTRKRAGDYYADQEVAETLEAPDCTVVLTKGSYGEYDDYALFLVCKPGSALGDGAIKRLVLPSTVCDNIYSGYKPTDRAPDSLALSEDGLTLRYTYYFDEALTVRGDVLHEAGEYTYTADLATGKQSVVLEDSYWKALADLTWSSDDRPFQLERQLETEACTIVLGMTKAIQYPRAVLALVYKDGSAKGAGEVVYLPTLSGSATHDSMAPHSLSLNEEKTVLTYTYQFDEDFKATRPPGGFYFVSHKAGTYTYTVDLATGEVTDTFVPKE